MNLTPEQKQFFEKNKIVILSTCDENNQSRAIYATLQKVNDDSLVIYNLRMDETEQNLLHNNKIFVMSLDKTFQTYLKITGIAQYKEEGDNKVITIQIKDIQEEK